VCASHTREMGRYLVYLEKNEVILTSNLPHACACAYVGERARQCVGVLHTREIGTILCLHSRNWQNFGDLGRVACGNDFVC